MKLTVPLPFSAGSILLVLSLLLPQSAQAQIDREAPLFEDLSVMDSLLFVEGFNKCDREILDRIVSDDLDFYHDQGGIQDKPLFMEATEQNICSTPDRKPIRKLVPGSMEVFPLYSSGQLYGAIQSGTHEFYIQEPGKDLYKTSIARFTHLWLLEEDRWLLSEVLSYDHQEPPTF